MTRFVAPTQALKGDPDQARPNSRVEWLDPVEALRAAWGNSEETVRAVIEPDRDRFLDAARRLAAKDRNGLADPEDVATELGIGLFEVTELVRRYQEAFDWASVPLGKLRPR
ncbi:MAG TPA: hypothetical protein VHY59_10840 [Chthoniobacterales bacterium]|nr:hypothetical protein [Chthoniobacterales bacterium]